MLSFMCCCYTVVSNFHTYDHAFLRKAQKGCETVLPYRLNFLNFLDIIVLEEYGTLQNTWRLVRSIFAVEPHTYVYRTFFQAQMNVGLLTP
jgi:hypothetical protein